MDKIQNNIIIFHIDIAIQRICNTFVNKLSYGMILNQNLNDAKLLYLYSRVLKDRNYTNDYLTEDEYNNIYIDVQRITKKTI